MKLKNGQSGSFVRLAAALLAIASLVPSSLAVTGYADGKPAKSTAGPSRLNEDQRILHVLNRLGFGARPGDIARVKAMGLDNYINQQLNPEKINDSVATAKLKDLTTLNMTTAELYEKFPQPGLLLKQLERRGALPAELAEARENRVKGGANAAPAQGEAMPNATDAKKDEAAQRNCSQPIRWRTKSIARRCVSITSKTVCNCHSEFPRSCKRREFCARFIANASCRK